MGWGGGVGRGGAVLSLLEFMIMYLEVSDKSLAVLFVLAG